MITSAATPTPTSNPACARAARGGIREYWIVNLQKQEIIVLTLPGEGADHYAVPGVFRAGDTAASVLLEGFGVDAAAVFEMGRAASSSR